MTVAPTLETERLRLRMPVLGDFPAFEALMRSDRAVFMGGPFTQFGAWGMFSHDIAGWALFGHGGLMIERLRDGLCVGQVSINHGPLFPEKELGWMLYEGHEGRGYATEAAIAYRAWAFDELGLETLVSYVERKNFASIAVARRLGATLDADAPREDADDLVFRHQRLAALK